MAKARATGADPKAVAKHCTVSNSYGTWGHGKAAVALQCEIPAFEPDHQAGPAQIAPEEPAQIIQQVQQQIVPNDLEINNRFNNVIADITNLRDAIDEDRTRMESMNDSLKKI